MMKKLHFLPIFIGLFVIMSCEKDKGLNDLKKIDQTLTVKNDILHFKNSNVLIQTLNDLNQKDDSTLQVWGKSMHFQSLHSVFARLIQVENDRNELYSNLPENEILKLQPIDRYSELYYQLLEKQVIKQTTNEDGSTSFDLNTCRPSHAKILNVNGVFVVGDTIFQYTDEMIKYWIKGDINNLQHLFSITQQTEDIKFITKKQGPLKSTSNSSDFYIDAGYHLKDSKRKLRMELTYHIWQDNSSGTLWSVDFHPTATSRKKNWIGDWLHNNTDMYMKGQWEADIKYRYPSSPYLSTFSTIVNKQFPSSYPTAFHRLCYRMDVPVCVTTGQSAPMGNVWRISHPTLGTSVIIDDIRILNCKFDVTGHRILNIEVAKTGQDNGYYKVTKDGQHVTTVNVSL